MNDSSSTFQKLVNLVAALRDPDSGCPWDKQQTHQSLKKYLIEESYEVLEAIDHFPDKLGEELGDVLLQVLLHSQIGAEDNRFTIDDVLQLLAHKIVTRHPHVFGSMRVETTAEVLKHWEQIKQQESGGGRGLLDGIPKTLPALLRAEKLGSRAARVGLDWETSAAITDKLQEEFKELSAELEAIPHDQERVVEELGDLLFTAAQLARKLDLSAEEILGQACRKFTDRFKAMESLTTRPLTELEDHEREALWDQVKRNANLEPKTR